MIAQLFREFHLMRQKRVEHRTAADTLNHALSLQVKQVAPNGFIGYVKLFGKLLDFSKFHIRKILDNLILPLRIHVQSPLMELLFLA